MTEFEKISDKELEKVSGGTNWALFGSCILTHGGSAIPVLAELVAAIVNNNWELVAILSESESIKSNPVVSSCKASN